MTVFFDFPIEIRRIIYTTNLVKNLDGAVPILEALGEWMRNQYLQVLPKIPIGKALAYPYTWLRAVLTQIPTPPINKMKELLPHNWVASQKWQSYCSQKCVLARRPTFLKIELISNSQ